MGFMHVDLSSREGEWGGKVGSVCDYDWTGR